MHKMFEDKTVFKFGFTGSSEIITDYQKDTLKKLLQSYIGKNPAECHNGACINADEECRNIVLSHFPHIRMIYHPPDNKSKSFKIKLRSIDEERRPLPYLKRNLEIVAESNYLFATPSTVLEQLRSGTWATIRYARAAEVPICLIFPNGSIRYEGSWPKTYKEKQT